MRDYGKVYPQFWVGRTGKAIRSLGPEAQIAALYLVTSPHSNMEGIYYLSLPVMCHETGLSMQGASKALESLAEAGFAHYDPEHEYVWVVEMARFQIAAQLDAADKRVKGIENTLRRIPNCKLLEDFRIKYQHSFHLRVGSIELKNGQAPSKPLRSQETEQENENEQDQEQENDQEQVVGAFPLSEGEARFEKLDWAEVLSVCDAVAKVVKPLKGKKQDRSEVIKAVALSRVVFSEDWLWAAVEKVKKNRKVKNPMGLFHSLLATAAQEQGHNLNQLMAKIEIPDAVMNPRRTGET